jgi:4-amino-4-deoxy-L-arabinose transferase-like glycosyltransferase
MRRSAPWLLLTAAIVIRTIAFTQISETPFVHLERWAQTDMHYYDGWARQIAAGDWLSRRLPLPMHRWHHDVAAAYFARHADVRAALARAGGDPDEAIWAQWMRRPRFYQDPLYPYLVAIVYRAIMPDVRAVLIVQLGLGVLTTWLVWSLARRHFGDLAAAFAGGLAVLCAPLVFYELLLLRDSLIACAGLAIVWIADRAARTDGWRWAAALGVALGAAFLLKSSLAVLAVGIVPVVLTVRRLNAAEMPARRVLVAAIGLVAGAAIALLPLIVRNVRVGAPPLSTASSGPLTFVSANEPGALPDVGFGINAALLARFLGGTAGSWPDAIAVTTAGATAASVAGHLWRKFDRSWHWYEIPNNENLYYLRDQVPALAWLPVSFRLIAPLALIGLGLAAVRRPRAWTLLSLVFACLMTLLLFYVLGRFRVALTAAVLPFAGLALAEVVTATRNARFRQAALLTAAAIGVAFWTGRPLADDQVLIRTSDYILAWSVEYQDRVYGALDRKDPAAAGEAYQEFFARYEPSYAEVANAADPRLVPELADMHAECAQILRAAGRSEAADVQLAAARYLLALRPLH